MIKVPLWERVARGMSRRMEPSLLIIGAQKAGTSALYAMLKQYPKVLAPSIKELNFFDRDAEYRKGMRHYRAQFPLKPFWGSGFVTFDASPSYLYDSGVCAERIARHLPKAMCLAILRDPVQRAYSAWNMFRDFKDDPQYGRFYDPRSFHQAVEDELAGRPAPRFHQYLLRSHYSGQIQDFKSKIAPDLLMIENYRDLRNDPVGFLARVCARIGVEPLPPDHAAYRIKSNARPYTERIDPGLAKDLYLYFVPEMERLRQVLGYDLGLLEVNG